VATVALRIRCDLQHHAAAHAAVGAHAVHGVRTGARRLFGHAYFLPSSA
jgi:hypothetical protein